MTDAECLAPIDKHKLSQDLFLVTSLLEMLAGHPCETDEQEAYWVRMLDSIHEMIEELEAERETLVRPLIRDKRLVDDEFKKVTGPANQLKTLIKGKLAERQERLLAAQTAAREAAQRAAKDGFIEACYEALRFIPDNKIVEGAKTQWVWDFSVVDASAVPRAFLALDEKAIARYVKLYAGHEAIPEVPGLSFKRTARVSVKGKAKS